MDFTRRDFLKSASITSFTLTLGYDPKVFGQILSKDLPPLEVIALNRLTFGPSLEDLEAYRKMGSTSKIRLQHFLEQQLNPSAISDLDCEQRIAKGNYTTLKKSLTQLWADHVVAAEKIKEEEKTPTSSDPKKELKMDENKLRMTPINELEEVTWLRAVYSKSQLQEVMVNFWHDHFSIFGWDQKISPVFTHFDRDIIRKNVFGNFRELLEAVAKSPAMLQYLDNAINQSGNPNENYARELFELHTLGAENYLGTMDRSDVHGFHGGQPVGYVDGDVYEAARCFTGWRIDQGNKSNDTGNFDYYEQWHDRFQKVVLGHQLKEYQPPLKDGHDVLDILAKHPGTARCVSRKLCRRFISDSPSKELVEKVSKVFLDNHNSHDQIKHVLRTIIYSKDFETNWGKKLRRPFESTVAFLRATKADFTPSEKFLKNFEKTGQKLFSCRTPDGYPDIHEKWMGASSLVERWHLTGQILLGQIPGIEIDLREKLQIKEEDPRKFIELMASRVMGRPISENTKKAAENFLLNTKERPRRFLFASALLFNSPDFQWL